MFWFYLINVSINSLSLKKKCLILAVNVYDLCGCNWNMNLRLRSTNVLLLVMRWSIRCWLLVPLSNAYLFGYVRSSLCSWWSAHPWCVVGSVWTSGWSVDGLFVILFYHGVWGFFPSQSFVYSVKVCLFEVRETHRTLNFMNHSLLRWFWKSVLLVNKALWQSIKCFFLHLNLYTL